MKKKPFTLGVFIDVSKAFSTVDLYILIKKINQYTVKGNNIPWFKSYIHNHKKWIKFIYLFIYSLIYFVYLFIYLFINLLFFLFIYYFFYLFIIYLFMFSGLLILVIIYVFRITMFLGYIYGPENVALKSLR